MDTDNERVRKDDPLRSLFREAGHLSAPVDLEAVVLERLSQPVVALQPEPALISLKGWLFIAALGLTLVVAGTAGSVPSDGPSFGPLLTSYMRIPELANALSSRWTVAAIAGILALAMMDRILVSRVRTFCAL